jgi:SAM-dependent methyltransferase
MRFVFYFLYIAQHWGISLACFIIRYEIWGEKQFGIRTIGIDNLTADVSKEDRKHAAMYEPVNYYTATWLFDHLQPDDLQTSLLDVGCGKGRILAIGAAYGFKDLTGIDISPKLCQKTRQATTILHQQYQNITTTITCVNARDYDITDTTGVIFLFNPFDDVVMKEFIQKVEESLARKPRPIKILYANPQCKQQWLDAGFTETASFVKMKYLKGCVLEK